MGALVSEKIVGEEEESWEQPLLLQVGVQPLHDLVQQGVTVSHVSQTSSARR